MKRIRRVEIIRYRRRSTVAGDEVGLEADPGAEQAAIDILSGISRPVEILAGETADAERQVSDAGDPGAGRGGRPLRFLKRLIRK